MSKFLLSMNKKHFPQVILCRVSDSEGLGDAFYLKLDIFGYPDSAKKWSLLRQIVEPNFASFLYISDDLAKK